MCRAAAAAVVWNIQVYLVAAIKEFFVKFTPACAQYFYSLTLI
jgi:hypothetical protein